MAIRDNSYTTVRYGRVRSYSGYEVIGEPGARVLRVGIPSRGTAEIVTRQGETLEFQEADIGTREFELRVLDRKYAAGEISYAEFVHRLRALINLKRHETGQSGPFKSGANDEHRGGKEVKYG